MKFPPLVNYCRLDAFFSKWFISEKEEWSMIIVNKMVKAILHFA
jgi:hypothetical protein